MHADFSLYRPMETRAFALPPHTGDNGKDYDASITVHLFGQSKYREPDIRLSMTVEEAESLAATLTDLVERSRAGLYSEDGHELLEYSKDQDIKKAFRVLDKNASTD
ncbi:hypothetical protein [Rhodococcus qingshengii]|uniref:hypothetical protein n=1 Tax=Rhodococcus qingshengii TaxID=334542 RepID=UPI0035A6981F